jgi:hypothetical protein
MLGRLVAILTFSRRPVSLTGPAKVIDGDTIVVADQMVRLHGIDAPELDQPLWWQGQKLMGGMMGTRSAKSGEPSPRGIRRPTRRASTFRHVVRYSITAKRLPSLLLLPHLAPLPPSKRIRRLWTGWPRHWS